MTNSKILLLGVLLSAGTFVVAAQGCGDDTSETTTAATTGGGATSTTSASSNGGGGNSSASSNGGGGTGATGGNGTGGGAPQTCEAYCADNAANCTGDLDQWGGYTSAHACQEWLPS